MPHLLVFRIARKADDLHAVEKRRRNVQGIGGGHEHDLGQIKVDLQVVIVEGVILLGIEHLEQCRGGITSKVHRHLVDLVEQEQRNSWTRPVKDSG